MASPFSRRALAAALAATALALAAACGGGGGDETPAGPPAAAAGGAVRLVVAGDSLADVGTFGLKATVQNASNPAAGYPVYPERVATQLGAGTLCNHFSSSDRLVYSTRAGCTDFAVGGAQILNPITHGGSALPLSLAFQLESALAANGGAWRAGDLILLDAGGNDAAALADAYLDARAGGTAEEAIYLALLGQQLDASTITQALAQPDGRAVAAGLYLQRLAQTWWSTVKANTLDRGATRVALLNLPDITLTPRFRGIVAGLASAEGSAAASAFQGALRQWIAGFNAELARLAAGEPRVALVPYFEDFTANVADPAAFGLTNATDASCPPAGDFPACTDAALDAAPPAGLAVGWWKTWYFSDEFHPSPRGHELIAATVLRALERAGWR
ncbi:SGNH/GDSL hydrolase family protein [Ramlibacter tataouinensis]|uniref:SGNH/GDSL hydrolase family protein n=1 Tax=Ramlibacter tataouinensis TaxID=94132 RepID=UPI0022F3E846|nr:SGNH/GDSL hydrolase family protein [Ramlibacter tataouinensis]WBY03276.1 SGNH/GDSL hydrolase family protein [Ramlibacter tataouinensis]